jgi:hypothetical protein
MNNRIFLKIFPQVQQYLSKADKVWTETERKTSLVPKMFSGDQCKTTFKKTETENILKCKDKSKVKVVPVLFLNWASRHEGVLGEWKYSSTHLLTSALDGGEWSASRPGRFTPPGKDPLVPIG